MTRTRLDVKEPMAAAWVHAGETDGAASGVVDQRTPNANRTNADRIHADRTHTDRPHVGAASSKSAKTATHTRGKWVRTGLRLLRDTAIGLMLVVSVPIVTVAARKDSMWFRDSSVRDRVNDANRMRPLTPLKDASISPMDAGLSYAALQSGAVSEEFPTRVTAVKSDRVWESYATTANMFTAISGGDARQVLSSRLIDVAPHGFTPAELAYLRAIADSPVWQHFDRVASANSVDMIGGQFVLPFRPGVSPYRMPMLRFNDTKELAKAGVARAAYYMAIGENTRAEAALHSVVGYGFALMDNGNSGIEALVGRVMVGIGRDALEEFYLATQAVISNETNSTLVKKSILPAASSRTAVDASARRNQLLRDIGDENAPRAVRFEGLRQLTFASCGSVKGMLWGLNHEEQVVLDNAKSSLARFESEQAYFDLLRDGVNRSLLVPIGESRGIGHRLIVGAATAAGAVLNNPRVEVCTRLLLIN